MGGRSIIILILAPVLVAVASSRLVTTIGSEFGKEVKFVRNAGAKYVEEVDSKSILLKFLADPEGTFNHSMASPYMSYYRPHLRISSKTGKVLSEYTPNHTEYIDRELQPEQVQPLLDSGHSLILNGIQNLKDLPVSLRILYDDLLEFQLPNANVNAYFSGFHGSALAPHQDTTDTIIVQVQGSKTWRLCIPPPLKTSTLNWTASELFDADRAIMHWMKERRDLSRRRLSENENNGSSSDVQTAREKLLNVTACHEMTTEPNDILYIPQGVVHHATSSSSLSVHLTNSVSRGSNSWAVLFGIMLNGWAQETEGGVCTTDVRDAYTSLVVSSNAVALHRVVQIWSPTLQDTLQRMLQTVEASLLGQNPLNQTREDCMKDFIESLHRPSSFHKALEKLDTKKKLLEQQNKLKHFKPLRFIRPDGKECTSPKSCTSEVCFCGICGGCKDNATCTNSRCVSPALTSVAPTASQQNSKAGNIEEITSRASKFSTSKRLLSDTEPIDYSIDYATELQEKMKYLAEWWTKSRFYLYKLEIFFMIINGPFTKDSVAALMKLGYGENNQPLDDVIEKGEIFCAHFPEGSTEKEKCHTRVETWGLCDYVSMVAADIQQAESIYSNARLILNTMGKNPIFKAILKPIKDKIFEKIRGEEQDSKMDKLLLVDKMCRSGYEPPKGEDIFDGETWKGFVCSKEQIGLDQDQEAGMFKGILEQIGLDQDPLCADGSKPQETKRKKASDLVKFVQKVSPVIIGIFKYFEEQFGKIASCNQKDTECQARVNDQLHGLWSKLNFPMSALSTTLGALKDLSEQVEGTFSVLESVSSTLEAALAEWVPLKRQFQDSVVASLNDKLDRIMDSDVSDLLTFFPCPEPGLCNPLNAQLGLPFNPSCVPVPNVNAFSVEMIKELVPCEVCTPVLEPCTPKKPNFNMPVCNNPSCDPPTCTGGGCSGWWPSDCSFPDCDDVLGMKGVSNMCNLPTCDSGSISLPTCEGGKASCTGGGCKSMAQMVESATSLPNFINYINLADKLGVPCGLKILPDVGFTPRQMLDGFNNVVGAAFDLLDKACFPTCLTAPEFPGIDCDIGSVSTPACDLPGFTGGGCSSVDWREICNGINFGEFGNCVNDFGCNCNSWNPGDCGCSTGNCNKFLPSCQTPACNFPTPDMPGCTTPEITLPSCNIKESKQYCVPGMPNSLCPKVEVERIITNWGEIALNALDLDISLPSIPIPDIDVPALEDLFTIPAMPDFIDELNLDEFLNVLDVDLGADIGLDLPEPSFSDPNLNKLATKLQSLKGYLPLVILPALSTNVAYQGVPETTDLTTEDSLLQELRNITESRMNELSTVRNVGGSIELVPSSSASNSSECRSCGSCTNLNWALNQNTIDIFPYPRYIKIAFNEKVLGVGSLGVGADHTFNGWESGVRAHLPTFWHSAGDKLITPSTAKCPIRPWAWETAPTRPLFNLADFDTKASRFKTIANISDATAISPTPAPTLPVSFKKVIEERQVAVVQTDMSLHLTPDEARHPVLLKSVETGLARALGYSPKRVTVTHVNGVSVDSRQLAGNPSWAVFAIEIQSVSTDTSVVDQLTMDVKAVAMEGSLVANVQEAASENGVLTTALSEMPLVLDEPEVAVSTQTVALETLVWIAPTKSPTKSPANRPTAPLPVVSTNSTDNTAAAVGGAAGGLIFLMFLAAGVWYLRLNNYCQASDDDNAQPVKMADLQFRLASMSVESMDTNGDGEVSRAEWMASKPAEEVDVFWGAAFDALDTDKSGTITKLEFDACVSGAMTKSGYAVTV
jgi:hypothetical protein